MKYFQFKSFATRLSIYVLSFTLIIFCIIMVLFYTFSRMKVTKYAVEHTHGQLTNMTTEINSLLEIVETTVAQSSWMIEDNLNHPDSLSRVLESVVKRNDLIISSAIAFVPDYYKEKGKYFMPHISQHRRTFTYRVLGGEDYDYFCMDWYLIPKLLKQNYWSEPYYDEGGRNAIISTYSYPLYDHSGNIFAILTASISLTYFTEMVGKLKPYESSYSFLLSRNGSYLTHHDRKRIMNETILSNAFEDKDITREHLGREMIAGHTGTIELSVNNKDSFAFYTSIPNIGWSVCNICPSNVILSELDSISQKIIFLFFAGMLVLFFITSAIIRRLVRPLEEFSHSSRAIAIGRFDVEFPEVYSHDEIKDLRDSLVYMKNSLSAYIAELKETTAIKERIESELSIAREIQMGMIPKIFPPFPERKDIDLYAILKPAKEVGGDLYDFFIENNRLYFVIGDVSGKGIPASLFMAITRSLFRTLSSGESSPASIVSGMNSSISDNNDSNMFVTLIIGILDLKSGILKLCNAGHNPPAFINNEGQVSFLNLDKNLFVGISNKIIYTDEEFKLKPGDKLFLYTDGVTEAENESTELYGENRLSENLSINRSLEVKELVETVVRSIASHVQDAEQSDDLTILTMHYKSVTE